MRNGRWDGEGPGHVRDAIERGRGGEVIARLAPARGELFLFKRRYSAFDNTPLRQALDDLDVEHVLLMGAATEGCVVQTGIDARELDLKDAERVAGIRLEGG
jgi:nicotinamidase-related amidase